MELSPFWILGDPVKPYLVDYCFLGINSLEIMPYTPA